VRIDHVALWTDDLERCTQFYPKYFGTKAGARYINQKKGFESCFLSFSDGARIEIVKTSALNPVGTEPGVSFFFHFTAPAQYICVRIKSA
jgi:lactoylglutathione lyase